MDFSVYPNPASEFVKISGAKNSNVEILTENGRLIEVITISSDNYSYDVSSLSSGVYTFRVTDDHGVELSLNVTKL